LSKVELNSAKMSVTEPDQADPERQEEEEEDDAPESVSFETSKAVALQAFKAESARNKAKNKSKKDRKKKSVNEAGEKSKLDLLKEQAESLFEAEEGSEGPETAKETPAQRSNVKKFDELDDLDEMLDEDQEAESEIVHGSTRFAVEKVTRHGTSHVPQSVLDLKKELLYGKGSRIRREPSKKSVDRKLKVAATGRNVLCKP